MTTPPLNRFDLADDAPRPRYKGVRTTSQYLTMPDSTQIAIDLMLPDSKLPLGKLPTLMIMARYWRSMALWFPSPPKRAPIAPREQTVDYFVALGFAVVVVDARGTGASTGVSLHPWSPDELADYAEVARWIAQQPWSSGRIGAYGISYEGATALRLAGLGVDAVKAVIPQEADSAFFAYLEEVDESGVVRYLTEGQLRAIHRATDDSPDASRPLRRGFTRAAGSALPIGETVALVIGLLPISALVRRGRRLRLALAGADAQTFARIPDAGAAPLWTVERSARAPSCLHLPIVPLSSTP